MANITHNATESVMKSRLKTLQEKLSAIDANLCPPFSRAVDAFLAAADYEDRTLMRSHLNAALESLQVFAEDTIRKMLEQSQTVTDTWREIWSMLMDHPCENYDELGRELESLFTTELKVRVSTREWLVQMLQRRGLPVANASQLDRDIEDLQNLKKKVLECWPWSGRPLPPVDRKMVAASRAAIARNEGENIQDLISRLGGNPSKPT